MQDPIDTILSTALACGPFLMVAAFVALGIGFGIMQSRNMQRQWTELAARTGLKLVGGTTFIPPALVGNYRSRPIKLHTYTRGSGKHKTRYTEVQLSMQNPSGYTLSLRREGLFDRMGKSMGLGSEIQIGDAGFDERYKIGASSQEFATRLLFGNERLRSALMQLEVPTAHIDLQGNGLVYRQTGFEGNGERVIRLLDLLSEMADTVETGSGIAAPERSEPAEAADKDEWGEEVEAEKPLFASDARPAQERAPDPFTQYGPTSYSPEASDPFARPSQPRIDVRTLLILFLAFDCLVAIGVLVYFLIIQQQ